MKQFLYVINVLYVINFLDIYYMFMLYVDMF